MTRHRSLYRSSDDKTTKAKDCDKAIVNKIFRDLRKAGFIAKQKFSCCRSCGWNDMSIHYPDAKNIVFYTVQANNFDVLGNLDSNLYLSWSGDGNKIKEIIEANGLKVKWDGTENNAIAIMKREGYETPRRYR